MTKQGIMKIIALTKIEEMIENCQKQAKSAWNKGVCDYCFDLIQDLKECEIKNIGIDGLEKVLLNGANNWSNYSWNGCSLIYNFDIAKRLCTPSEFRRKKEGELKPNKNEEWLDTQARALYQAYRRIKIIIYRLIEEE